MIRHIVMFKLKDYPNEILKKQAALEVKNRLDQLPKNISFIQNYQAGIDTRKLEWSYDIVLQMDFNNLTEVDAYTIHPSHQEFIAFNKDYSVFKVSVDYEILTMDS